MGAPELLKAMLPSIRRIETHLVSLGYVKGTKEFETVFNHTLAFQRKFGVLA